MRPLFILMMLAVLCLAALADYGRSGPGIHAAIVTSASVALFLFCLRPQRQHEMAVRSIGIVAGMPLLAWTLPDVRLLYLIMCIWVPLMARGFGQIAPVYLLSLLLLPPLDMDTGIGGLKLFEFGVLDALALGATVAIMANPSRLRPPVKCDAVVGALLLVFSIALSRDTSLSHLLRVTINIGFDFGLPYYILSRGLRTTEDLRTAMCWLACGGLALSGVLTYEVWRAWPMYNELYPLHGVDMVLLVKTRGGLLRAGGPFVEPTSIAMVVAMCATAIWLLRDQFRSGFHHTLVLAVAVVGMSAPQSRSAWIGFCIALAASDLFRGRYFALARKSLVIGIAATAVFTAAELSPSLSESVGLSGNSSASSEYRRDLLRRGMEEFWHSPLVGFSGQELTARLEDMRQGEGIIDYVNTFLWMALISGPLGLFTFVAAFAISLRGVRRAKGKMVGATEIALAAIPFSCLMMFAEMLFFTSFGGRVAYLTFGMFGMSAALIAMGRSAEPRRVAAPESGLPPQAALA